MKSFLPAVFALFFAVNLVAQEYDQDYESVPDFDSSELLDAVEPQLETAPAHIVAVILQDCKTWATEDQIEPEKMGSYLLDCVNESLGYEGYLPVSSLKP